MFKGKKSEWGQWSWCWKTHYDYFHLVPSESTSLTVELIYEDDTKWKWGCQGSSSSPTQIATHVYWITVHYIGRVHQSILRCRNYNHQRWTKLLLPVFDAPLFHRRVALPEGWGVLSMQQQVGSYLVPNRVMISRRCWAEDKEIWWYPCISLGISNRTWGAMETCAHPSGEADDVALMTVRRGVMIWLMAPRWPPKMQVLLYLLLDVLDYWYRIIYGAPSLWTMLTKVKSWVKSGRLIADVILEPHGSFCLLSAVQSSCSFALVCVLFGLRCPFDFGCVSVMRVLTSVSVHNLYIKWS